MKTNENIRKIDDYLNSFKSTLNAIIEYSLKSDLFIKETTEKIDKDINERTKGLEMEEMVNLMNIYYEQELNKYLGLFPDIKNKSLIILAYSFLETSLRNLSYQIRDIERIKTKPDNFRGDGILKYKLFLTNEIGVDFKTFKSSWDKINSFRLVRNAIVHNQSDLELNERISDYDKSKLIVYIKSLKGVVLIDNRFIGITTTDYIIESLKIIEELIGKISNAYIVSIKRHLN
jgi:hypothetical protein